MAVYAIGDLQGCYSALQNLLDKLAFEPARDQLWFTGDLVNRGPESLACLRFVKSLGNAAISVLGNHDLHLIAQYLGSQKSNPKDTLAPILNAKDCDELIDWLRSKPLLHHDNKTSYTLVHAGIYPYWSLQEAQKLALEVEQQIQGEQSPQLFRNMYGDTPRRWTPGLDGMSRTRFIINAFTRMRYCEQNGKLDFKCKLSPGQQNSGLYPWFELIDTNNIESTILFGHWSTVGKIKRKDIIALDSGCVWGGQLTAMRLGNEPEYFSVNCKAATNISSKY